MSYVQKNNPFSVTSCGRRRTFMQENNESALRRLRKTTVGEGRHFRSTDEGAGMTDAGVKAYKKEPLLIVTLRLEQNLIKGKKLFVLDLEVGKVKEVKALEKDGAAVGLINL